MKRVFPKGSEPELFIAEQQCHALIARQYSVDIEKGEVQAACYYLPVPEPYNKMVILLHDRVEWYFTEYPKGARWSDHIENFWIRHKESEADYGREEEELNRERALIGKYKERQAAYKVHSFKDFDLYGAFDSRQPEKFAFYFMQDQEDSSDYWIAHSTDQNLDDREAVQLAIENDLNHTSALRAQEELREILKRVKERAIVL